LGDAQETVHGGTGNDTFLVNSSTIGATIDGGTGKSTLDVTGGGTMAMGGNITNISNVLLVSSTTPYNFTANGISGLIVNDASKGLDTITAGGTNQTLTGGGVGKETMIGSVGGGDTFKDTAALFNGDTIKNFAAAGSVIDLTDMNPATVQQPLFTEDGSNTFGTLSVTDGTHNAAITLFGQFTTAGFHTSPDSGVGTLVTFHPQLQAQLHLASPHG
jgi:hypothetical protein